MPESHLHIILPCIATRLRIYCVLPKIVLPYVSCATQYALRLLCFPFSYAEWHSNKEKTHHFYFKAGVKIWAKIFKIFPETIPKILFITRENFKSKIYFLQKQVQTLLTFKITPRKSFLLFKEEHKNNTRKITAYSKCPVCIINNRGKQQTSKAKAFNLFICSDNKKCNPLYFAIKLAGEERNPRERVEGDREREMKCNLFPSFPLSRNCM